MAYFIAMLGVIGDGDESYGDFSRKKAPRKHASICQYFGASSKLSKPILFCALRKNRT